MTSSARQIVIQVVCLDKKALRIQTLSHLNNGCNRHILSQRKVFSLFCVEGAPPLCIPIFERFCHNHGVATNRQRRRLEGGTMPESWLHARVCAQLEVEDLFLEDLLDREEWLM